MDFDLSVREHVRAPSPPSAAPDLPPERPTVAALFQVAKEAPRIPSEPPSSEDEKDDEWRIATGKRGRGTPSPELDPALKMLRGAIDQMPPGATDLFGDPMFDLPPMPQPAAGSSHDVFDGPANAAEAFDNPLAAGPAGSSGDVDKMAKFANSPGLLRDDGGLAAWMNRKPRKGKERALVQ